MFKRLSVFAGLFLIISSTCAESADLNCDVSFLRTTRLYYNEPAYTISDISGNECLVTINRVLSTVNGKAVKSQKFAAYDSETACAYNDVCTTVTITKDARGNNSLMISELREDFNSPGTGPKQINDLAKEFLVDGTRYLFEKNNKGDGESDFVTSSSSNSHSSSGLQPLAALNVPAGEPSRTENGLPVFKTAMGDVYVSLDRSHIVKVIGNSTTGHSIETTYNNFVSAPNGRKLPTEITTVRSYKGKPQSSISYSNISYKPSESKDIAALYEATRAQFQH